MPDATYLVPSSGSATGAQYVDAVVRAPAGVAAYRCYNLAASPVAYAAPTTGTVPVLYNPPGSNVNIRIMAVRVSGVAGSMIAGSLGYGWSSNASLSSVTAGPAPIPGFLAGTNAAFQGLWYTTCTSAAAPTFITAGWSSGGAVAAGPVWTLCDIINGFITLGQGAAFYPICSINAVALTAVCAVDVIQTPA